MHQNTGIGLGLFQAITTAILKESGNLAEKTKPPYTRCLGAFT
jgi:hypothetical protein